MNRPARFVELAVASATDGAQAQADTDRSGVGGLAGVSVEPMGR